MGHQVEGQNRARIDIMTSIEKGLRSPKVKALTGGVTPPTLPLTKPSSLA